MTKPLKISGGEDLRRRDHEASFAARVTGHQAGQCPDGHPAQGQEEVDMEVQGGGTSLFFQDSNMLRRTKYSKTVDNVNNYWVEV
jgi:hypothetical protein